MALNTDTQFIWKGEGERELQLSRGCGCGTCQQAMAGAVGLLTGSTAEGEGFTILIEDEDVYQRLSQVALEQGVLPEYGGAHA